jgi:predicted NBD/HSP70 family sugar kinase
VSTADFVNQPATRSKLSQYIRADHRGLLRAAGRLGSGLASLINLTDPDRVVLAGSLARYRALAADALAGSLTARSFLSHADPVDITTAALPDAPLLGAADLALQPLLDDPRTTLATT